MVRCLHPNFVRASLRATSGRSATVGLVGWRSFRERWRSKGGNSISSGQTEGLGNPSVVNRSERTRARIGWLPEARRILIGAVGLFAMAVGVVALFHPTSLARSDILTTTTSVGGFRIRAVETVRHTSISDTLTGGLIGLGALFIVLAVVVDRIRGLFGRGYGAVLDPPPLSHADYARLREGVVEGLNSKWRGNPTDEAVVKGTEIAVTEASRLIRIRFSDAAHLDGRKAGQIGPIDVVFRTRLTDEEIRRAILKGING